MPIADKVEARETQPRFRRDVRLVLDAAAFSRAQDLNFRLEQALVGNVDDDDVTVEGPVQIAEQLDALHREHPPALFTFEARTPSEWTDLVADHQGKPDLWHRVVAECAVVFEDDPVDPDELTVDLVKRYAETLTPGQWQTLVECVRALNEALFDLRPTKAASAVLGRMRPSSTSATAG